MSAVTTTHVKLSPEEFLELPDGVNYELVDGQLVERHMGAESSEIALRIAFILETFLRTGRIGRLFGSDTNYQCFPHNPLKFRKPDVSFVRLDRLPNGRAPKGQLRIPPDLAVEVISPGDVADEVEEKVGEYLAAGVPLVWVVYPGQRTVRIHRSGDAGGWPVAYLSDRDAISGEHVLPGFTCPVREFFDGIVP